MKCFMATTNEHYHRYPYIYALAGSAGISEGKRTQLADLSNTSHVSAASITELMIKASLVKPHIDFEPVDMAKQSGVAFLDFNADAGELLKDMPFHNKDPFGRMAIAQNISHIFFQSGLMIRRNSSEGCRERWSLVLGV